MRHNLVATSCALLLVSGVSAQEKHEHHEHETKPGVTRPAEPQDGKEGVTRPPASGSKGGAAAPS